jgi:hypothetical protein
VSFQSFLGSIGKRPSSVYSFGRIDNNGGYFPGNVEWQTRKQQCRNRRSNRVLKVRGKRITISELAETLGVYRSTIRKRLELGWSVRRIEKVPVDHRRGNHR